MASKRFPDLASANHIQRGIVQAGMDPAMEGIVDLFDAVGSEEQYALIVFRHANEDRY